MSQGIVQTLLSGFAGALVVQLLTIAWAEWKRWREKHALLEGIVAECDYNLSIVDEILTGVIQGGGSFKRMSVDYFRTVREATSKYSFDKEFLRTLSRAIVDLELYNLEANYVFNGFEGKCIYAGAVDEKPVLVERRPNGHNISDTMTAARKGVSETLTYLKSLANKALEGEEE